MNLANFFMAARKAKKIKQYVAAASAGVSKSAFARFESGKLMLSTKTLLKIAPELDINPAFLSGDSDLVFLNTSDGTSTFFIDTLENPLIEAIKINGNADSILIVTPHPALTHCPGLVYAVAVLSDKTDCWTLFRAEDPNGTIAYKPAVSGRLEDAFTGAFGTRNITQVTLTSELKACMDDWSGNNEKLLSLLELQASKKMSQAGAGLEEKVDILLDDVRQAIYDSVHALRSQASRVPRAMPEVLDELKRLKRIPSDTALGALFGVNQSTVAGWRRRETLPYAEIIQLCITEGISLDRLFSKPKE